MKIFNYLMFIIALPLYTLMLILTAVSIVGIVILFDMDIQDNYEKIFNLLT